MSRIGKMPVEVPVQVTSTIMTTHYRPMIEYTTNQVPVSVPEQVPVTVMTTQQRQVPRQVAVSRCVWVPATSPTGTAPTTTPAAPTSPQN